MRRRSSRGITLAELLVTVVIIGVVTPGILLASGNAARIGRTAQKRAVARGLVVRQLELFREMCRKSSVTTGTTSSMYAGTKLGNFAISRTITLSSGLGGCEVTVSWSDTRGNGVFTDSLQMGTSMRVGS